MIKQVTFRVKGMQRDLSMAVFNNEYAYEMKNMRLAVDTDNTLGSITNERGNIIEDIWDADNPVDGAYTAKMSFVGTPIGQAVIDNCYIMFFHYSGTDGNKDTIYKIYLDDNNYDDSIVLCTRLYEGDLNFSTNYPIETLVFYESNHIRKVYWTDNYNQPRLLNIDKEYYSIDTISKTRKYSDSLTFDFIPKINLNSTITIKKNVNGNGSFPAGIVQYSFTYFDKYGHESNVFYTSSLYYTSLYNRAGTSEESVSNSFTITIVNPDRNFDCLRIYSIIRTSENATPVIKKVTDIEIPSIIGRNILVYEDSNLTGEDVPDSSLLFKGGEVITVKTFNQKDNTLFLGNIETKRKSLKDINNSIKEAFDIEFIEESTDIRNTNNSSEIYSWSISLDKPKKEITTFKSNEWYRLGVQFQDNIGKWSDVIYIGDYHNDKVPNSDLAENLNFRKETFHRVIIKATIKESKKDIIDTLKNNYNFVKIRPVIVYPSINDRECICQGVVCPTIYNVEDRYNNTPYVQSSWFIRPNNLLDVSSNSKSANFETEGTYSYEGAWAEFRHNRPLPPATCRNAEFQFSTISPKTPRIGTVTLIVNVSDIGLNKQELFVECNKDAFYIDQSICTLHSPDIEYDTEVQNLDMSNTKFRIVGVVPITASSSDFDITTSNSPAVLETLDNKGAVFGKGLYKKVFSYTNTNHKAWRKMITGIFWYDATVKKGGQVTSNHNFGYAIYPWHRTTTLTNDCNVDDHVVVSKLKNKRMSNFAFSIDNKYLFTKDVYNPITYETSDIQLFTSNEVTLLQLKNNFEGGKVLNYYGNVSKIVTPNNIKYEVITNDTSSVTSSTIIDKTNGYDIIGSGYVVYGDANLEFSTYYTKFKDELKPLESFSTYNKNAITKGTEGIPVKYKSTPHAVIVLKGDLSTGGVSEGTMNILPTNTDNNGAVMNDMNEISDVNHPLYWRDKYNLPHILNTKQIGLKHLAVHPPSTVASYLNYGYLWLGEIYREVNTDTIFGGKSSSVLENTTWIPAGEPVLMTSDSVIEWTEGDTYYQRYDHIKTYPYSNDDIQSMCDIISFMCETHVNIDGRSDRNRLNYNNLLISPDKFGVINRVYSQENNYYTYSTVNDNKVDETAYNNIVTWGSTKTEGEYIDSWTNITLASTLNFDATLGEINSIKRFNNELVVFQDRGVSTIQYNENVQISSDQGVPIEILNSGKVTGKRYISNTIGTHNKWAICETPDGIIFKDDNSKGLYLFDSKVSNLSDKLGFSSYIRSIASTNIWASDSFANSILYYDTQEGDVLIINRNDSVALSLKLGAFSSFYDYNNSPYFVNIWGQSYLWHKRDGVYNMWHQHAGEYNSFFGEYKDYYIDYIVNPDPTKDKIFNNIEFRSESYSSDGINTNNTFNKITIDNEYQHGESNLILKRVTPSSLKRKFRIWRALLPRDKKHPLDRIRNPWAKIRLEYDIYNNNSNEEMSAPNTDRTILYDATVSYFEND